MTSHTSNTSNKEHRWLAEMEIETHMGQRALYKIPFWCNNEKTARQQAGQHANEMQSGIIRVCSLDVYKLDSSTIVLPGLYPLEQRHHLHKPPITPFDSVQHLPSFEQSLKQEFWKGGKYTSVQYHNRKNADANNRRRTELDDDEETTQLIFDSIESEPPDTIKVRPLWKRLLCCFGSDASMDGSNNKDNDNDSTNQLKPKSKWSRRQTGW